MGRKKKKERMEIVWGPKEQKDACGRIPIGKPGKIHKKEKKYNRKEEKKASEAEAQEEKGRSDKNHDGE